MFFVGKQKIGIEKLDLDIDTDMGTDKGMYLRYHIFLTL